MYNRLSHFDIIFEYARRSHCGNYVVDNKLAIAGQEVALLVQLLDAGFILGNHLFQREYIMLYKVVQYQMLIHARLVLQAADVLALAARQLIRVDYKQVANRLIGLSRNNQGYI